MRSDCGTREPGYEVGSAVLCSSQCSGHGGGGSDIQGERGHLRPVRQVPTVSRKRGQLFPPFFEGQKVVRVSVGLPRVVGMANHTPKRWSRTGPRVPE